MPTIPSYEERLKWFHEVRFGIFIHWGLYSLLGRGEWAMYRERIPVDEYSQLANEFTAEKFDANAWAQLAVDAGAKYMVFTTRHHDGFCLYDSHFSDFTSTKTAARRDFVAEYVEACRRASLKVGLYYSMCDWRFPGYWNYATETASAQALKDQAHSQVRELMTDYGRIDELFYDGHMLNHENHLDPSSPSQGFWEPTKLNAMVRELQPHIIINNRAGSNEDLDTPEQHVTASEPGRGWEANMTMGDWRGWGYMHHNPSWKPAALLLQHLVEAAAGEGNFLLNLGPHGDGNVREEETSRLHAIGEWMRLNGEAIYGSQRCAISAGNLGEWTRRGNTGYLHVFHWPGEEIVLPLVATEALSATVLATGQKAMLSRKSNERLILSCLPPAPPDPSISVLKIEFAAAPKTVQEPDTAAWLTGSAA
jgi:alpha-L-fucosidase